MKINKILIANRGEIALRIMRSAKEMGIKTVAVYSDADRTAMHVRYADEAVHIGASPSNQSYLRGEKIISAAKQTGAQAIHPGYGFLSENAAFADEVKNAGLIFIGPSADSMRMMGSKLAAKETAKKYNIPMVPGTEGAISDVKEAIAIAKKIGFPILIKASAGGGGKGMRMVNKESELEEQMKMAIGEAVSSFGDGAVFIEKYVAAPRHIEIQVLGDQHGNVVYLFERECSVQRRHQKLVEEAPSSILTPELRERMGKSAATNIGASLLTQLLGLGQVGQTVTNYGAQLLTLQFSRDNESEADLVGMELAARAGYDPRAGVTLWQKMSAANKGAPPQWLSTHPSGNTRIGDIEANLPKVLPLYERVKTN